MYMYVGCVLNFSLINKRVHLSSHLFWLVILHMYIDVSLVK